MAGDGTAKVLLGDWDFGWIIFIPPLSCPSALQPCTAADSSPSPGHGRGGDDNANPPLYGGDAEGICCDVDTRTSISLCPALPMCSHLLHGDQQHLQGW